MSLNLPNNQRNLILELENYDHTMWNENFQLFVAYLQLVFFWFDLFLEANAEIPKKVSMIFWETWRHQKDISKSTDL